MLLNPEERMTYWGYSPMNVACRDINDDEEPDLTGLERILYGVGFLAITSLSGITAFDDEVFSSVYDSAEPENESEDTGYSYSMDNVGDKSTEYFGDDNKMQETRAYPLEHDAEQIVLRETEDETRDKKSDEIGEEAPMPDELEGAEEYKPDVEEPIPALVLEHILLNKAA